MAQRPSGLVSKTWHMSLRRTNVYADAADLALIKEAAARRGVSEAEIIREGIHLAAMSSRVWDEPLAWPTFEVRPAFRRRLRRFPRSRRQETPSG
jgi:hypothetical protein